jgi:hypothetical protein
MGASEYICISAKADAFSCKWENKNVQKRENKNVQF